MKYLIVISLCVFLAGCTSERYRVQRSAVIYRFYILGSVDIKRNVAGSDAASFRDLGRGYGLDKSSVYFRGSRINDADPNTFGIIDSEYSKDKSHVFYWCCPLPYASPVTFQRIDSQWSKDDAHVYHDQQLVPNANPNTFRVLSNGWAIDANRAFFGLGGSPSICNPNDPIFPAKWYIAEGIDPTTFEVLEMFYARDSTGYYDALKQCKTSKPPQDLIKFLQDLGTNPMQAKTVNQRYMDLAAELSGESRTGVTR